MNKRIYELAKQAGLIEFEPIGDLDAVTPDYTSVVKAQEFAELIIQECQSRIEQYVHECGQIGCLPEYVLNRHFGVVPAPKCSVCGTTEDVKWVGGYQPYLCASADCIPF